MTLVMPPGWNTLTPGTKLTIVKQAPDGHEVARYSGHVLTHQTGDGWIAARATWTYRAVGVDGLWFRPGDTLDEYFSASEWFNAFLVVAPNGERRGWYANVTYPVELKVDLAGPLLVWRDLYIDVIVRGDGTVAVQDEDELADANLAQRAPNVYKKILATRDLILGRIQEGSYPFDQ
jgi:hypothetical protein